jgi:LysM repeat protein
MKQSLKLAALSMILATPSVFAKSELETLRSLCAEQERQIRQLEDENSKLRSDTHQELASKPKSESKAGIKAPTDAATTPTESSYTVKAGDSMDKIARKVGMTPEKLAKTNGLKENAIIQPGQKLKITGASAPSNVATKPPTPDAIAAPTAPVAKDESKAHTVKQGETYFSISKKYKVSTASLIAANPSVKASAMRPGQVLKIVDDNSSTTTISTPVTPSKTAVEKTPAPAAKTTETEPSAPAKPAPAAAPTAQAQAPAPAAEQEDTASTPDNKLRPVTIDGEMTYGEFASKHGTDAERLNALNGLDLTTATVLAKGSELYVPGAP